MIQPPQSPESRSRPQNGAQTSKVGSTDQGRRRTTNEDPFVTAKLMMALWVQQSSARRSTVRYTDDCYECLAARALQERTGTPENNGARRT